MQLKSHISLVARAAGIVACLMLSLHCTAQPTVGISHYQGCPGHPSVITVYANHFNEMAAMSLFITMDTASVAFVRIESILPALLAGSFVSNFTLSGQPSLNISWYGPPLNFSHARLFDFVVVYKGRETEFLFTNSCELARSDYSVVNNAVFVTGSIRALGNFISEPAVVTVIEGSPVEFSVPEVAGVSYHWQEGIGESWTYLSNENGYEGVFAPVLRISSVAEEQNNRLYRCVVSHKECYTVSDASHLLVLPSGLDATNMDNRPLMKVFPNPFTDELYCYLYNNGIVGDAALRMVDLSGRTILYAELGTIVPGQGYRLVPDEPAQGIYVLELLQRQKLLTSVRIVRKL